MAADLNIVVNGAPVPVYLGENTAISAIKASQAAQSADAAAASEAVALAAAGPNYADTSDGLAATSEGETFAVEDGGIVTVYRHDSGPVATELRVLPTTAALASTDSDKGAALVDATQNATGAATRNVRGKLAEIWSPADFAGTDTEKLQAFFDYIGANNVPQAELTGVYEIDAPVTISGGATKSLRCNLEITATAEMDEMIVIDGIDFLTINGRIKLQGTGTSSIASRTVQQAIRLHGAGRCHIDVLEVIYFQKWGILSPRDDDEQNSSGLTVGKMRAQFIGTYGTSGATTITSPFTSNTQSGSSQSLGQTSVLGGVSVIPDALDPDTQDFVIINDEPYLVTAVDRDAQTVTVYPWVPNTVTSGDMRFVYGSPVGLFSLNSNVTRIGHLTALQCAIGWHDKSPYPGLLDMAIIQACTFGLTLGNGTNSSSWSPKIMGYYAELNEFDIVQTSNVLHNAFLAGQYLLPLDKWFKLAPKTATGTAASAYKSYGPIFFTNDGVPQWKYPTPGGNLGASAATLKLGECASHDAVFRDNTKTITLEGDTALNAGTGATYVRIVLLGSGSNKNPTGNITLQAATVGGVTGKINGAASEVFASTAGPFVLHCYWQVATNNWIVTQEVIPAAPLATYTATNVTTDRSFDANAGALTASAGYVQTEAQQVSNAVAELADVLGTLIADLRARGIVL